MTLRRRYFLFGGLGAAGAAGGVWWAGRQERPAEEDAEDAAGLWLLRFPQPGGGELVMAALRGRPLVLNFWATWCPPCVKEMPDLDRFQRQFAARGWQVVGLAVDSLAPVREFLARTPVSYVIGLAGAEGVDLSRRLGNERGGLPFSVVFDAQGRVLRRKLGETSFEELTGWGNAS